jgi:hypothetical protein
MEDGSVLFFANSILTRFFTMSSVASSYLDTRYSGETRERNICINRWKDAPTNFVREGRTQKQAMRRKLRNSRSSRGILGTISLLGTVA